MSLQPAIPWRVALQQSPTPLHRLSTTLKGQLRLEKTITLNSNCVFERMSHSRGSPQGLPGLKDETWGTQQWSGPEGLVIFATLQGSEDPCSLRNRRSATVGLEAGAAGG